jgi:hypothetical protein
MLDLLWNEKEENKEELKEQAHTSTQKFNCGRGYQSITS